MDPNEALERMRQLLRHSYGAENLRPEHQELLDKFEALDQWLSHPCHGSLPGAWAGPAGDRKVTEAGACGACQKAAYPFRHQKPPNGAVEVSRRRKVGESFLDVVLCVRDNCGDQEYVTWIHNLQAGGYCHGHYGKTAEKHDFDERVGS